ncbi:MAG: ribosome silencing factor [Acidimicrobiales bacterium]
MAEATKAAAADPLAWACEAARAADDKQGKDTVVLDVGAVLEITGWFVITSAHNSRLVRTIAETVEERVVAVGGPKPLRVEGLDSGEWILLDYGDFVVHVFGDETRAFYELERLYRDMPSVDWSVATA